MWSLVNCINRFFLILIPFLFQIKTANSQESRLTEEIAIQEGLAHSPVIQKTEAILEQTQWRRSEYLGSGFLPKLSLSGTKFIATQYTISIIPGLGNFPGFYPNTTFSLDLNIPVFDGLANIKNLQGASFLQEAAKKELARAKFQLKKDIQLGFYQALAASQLNLVSKENVKTMENHLKQVTAQKKGGVATQYDVLRVEVQLSDARADAIDAEDRVILTRKKLSQLMGLESDYRPIFGELPIPDVSKVKVITFQDQAIIDARDDIQALNFRAEAAGKFHSAQKAWISPILSIGGQYIFYDQQQVNFAASTVNNTGNFQGAYNIGVFLKWNLFDGGVSLARANQAAYQEVEALKTSETALIAMPYDFDDWKRRFLSNADHYLSKKLDITRSEESVRLSQEEERAGTRTSTETLDAELDLFRARAGAISAQLNAAEAQIHLELVIGRDI